MDVRMERFSSFFRESVSWWTSRGKWAPHWFVQNKGRYENKQRKNRRMGGRQLKKEQLNLALRKLWLFPPVNASVQNCILWKMSSRRLTPMTKQWFIRLEVFPATAKVWCQCHITAVPARSIQADERFLMKSSRSTRLMGGPTFNRNISINTALTLCDKHLDASVKTSAETIKRKRVRKVKVCQHYIS